MTEQGIAPVIDNLKERPTIPGSHKPTSEKQNSSSYFKAPPISPNQDRVALRNEIETLAGQKAHNASRPDISRSFKTITRFTSGLEASSFVERLLWRRFLDARQDLMKSYVSMQATASTGGSMNWGAVDAEAARHSQAIEAFQQANSFSMGTGKLKEKHEGQLLVQATRTLVVDDYEQQARKNGDEHRVNTVRSIRAEFEQSHSDMLTQTEALVDWEDPGHLGLVRKLAQFFVAGMFGGLMLLIPMTIMVLSPGILTSLLTTTLFVYLFTSILAYIFTSSGNNQAQLKDILAIVAAYAAVLVVFVGTSAQNQEKANRTTEIVLGLVLGIPGLLVLGLGLVYYLGSLFDSIKSDVATDERD